MRFFNLEKNRNAFFLFSGLLSFAASAFFVWRGSFAANPPLWLDLGWIYFLFILSIFIFLIGLVFLFRNPADFTTVIKKILLVFLPAVIILFAGFRMYNRLLFFPMSLPLQIITGLYAAMGGIFFLFKLQNYKKISDFAKSASEKKKTEPMAKKWGALAILFLVITLNLSFGSYHLAEFAAVDEPLWTFDRIPKFWHNISDHEFYKTMISDKPGITVAIISGIGMNWTQPTYYKLVQGSDMKNVAIPGIKKMNFVMRLPIFLFNALLLIPLYFFIKRLSKSPVALFSIILIGLSPILLGMSTIINPDSLLWSISTLSFLGYLIYLKDKEKKYLYYSGFFLGLAILTKYIANIFYVFFFGLIFLEYIINREKYNDTPVSQYFKRAFADYFSLVLVSLLAFFAFLPAAWVNVYRVAEATIFSKAFMKFWPIFLVLIGLVLLDIKFKDSKITAKITEKLSKYKKWIVNFILGLFLFSIIAAMADTYFGMKPYDFESILASPKSSYLNSSFFSLYLANYYSLIFGLVPLAFLAFVFWPIKNILSKKTGPSWPVYIILFIIVYYLASTVENVSATVRYQIIVYPLSLIIAAFGIYEFLELRPIKKYFIPFFAYIILIGASAYSLNFIRPFYMSYASDLLPKQYVLNLKDMGDGSYEAAQYLNNRPDADKLIVWTDKRGVCYFFVGSCQTGFDFDKDGTIFDYYVVSSGRESRTTKMTLNRVGGGNKALFRLDKLYDIQNPEYKLEIGGRPNSFVKVINAQNL